ncbi:glycosyltransferase family 2 protein [Oleidesulfovibrio alaskensis]
MQGGGARDFLFSVVTAAYNCEPWLDTCIASLASQSLGFEEHIQLVLVDDGSQDGTAAVAGRWAARYPDNILVLRTENGGVAAPCAGPVGDFYRRRRLRERKLFRRRAGSAEKQ